MSPRNRTVSTQKPPTPFGVPRPVGPSRPARAVHSCDGEQVPFEPEVTSKKVDDESCVYG
jgi:hypothetical protein